MSKYIISLKRPGPDYINIYIYLWRKIKGMFKRKKIPIEENKSDHYKVEELMKAFDLTEREAITFREICRKMRNG